MTNTKKERAIIDNLNNERVATLIEKNDLTQEQISSNTRRNMMRKKLIIFRQRIEEELKQKLEGLKWHKNKTRRLKKKEFG